MSKIRRGAPAGTDAMPPRPGMARRHVFLFSVPLAILSAGAYLWLSAGRLVSTDNAAVQRDVVAVSSAVDGPIIAVRVRENQVVKKGDILFAIDPQPYRAALDQANAQIASARMNVDRLEKNLQTSAIDIANARSDVYQAQEGLEQQQALMAQGFTTRTRLQQSEQDLADARKRLRQMIADTDSVRATLATSAQAPGVNSQLAAAQALHDQTALRLENTIVRAPVAGRISQAGQLQVGQIVTSRVPMLSIVTSETSWITANFKDSDLKRMRVGQTATIWLDGEPDFKLTGHVERIGADAAPAEKARGNGETMTQRVPVRIMIDGKPAHPMVAGLGAKVTVDVTSPGKAEGAATP